MACEKCAYRDKKSVTKFNKELCRVCAVFAPQDETQFNLYLNEKLNWRDLDTFRKYNQTLGGNQKKGMNDKAKLGSPVTRAPLGFDIIEGNLVPNQAAAKVHSIFKVFLEKDYSLNSMAKHYALSVNGLKKVLKNRTYLGEVKFAGNLHKGNHKEMISPEIFYAVQRKLKERSRTKDVQDKKETEQKTSG